MEHLNFLPSSRPYSVGPGRVVVFLFLAYFPMQRSDASFLSCSIVTAGLFSQASVVVLAPTRGALHARRRDEDLRSSPQIEHERCKHSPGAASYPRIFPNAISVSSMRVHCTHTVEWPRSSAATMTPSNRTFLDRDRSVQARKKLCLYKNASRSRVCPAVLIPQPTRYTREYRASAVRTVHEHRPHMPPARATTRGRHSPRY